MEKVLVIDKPLLRVTAIMLEKDYSEKSGKVTVPRKLPDSANENNRIFSYI